MTAAFSQSKTVTFNGTASTWNVALTSGVTSGDTLVVVIGTNGGGTGDVTSISGCGATWTRLDGVIESAVQSERIEFWVGFGATTGSTVTIVLSNVWSGDAVIGVFNGASSQIAHPAPVNNAGGATATPITPTLAATATGQAVVGAVVSQISTARTVSGYTDSPGAWTTIAEITDPQFGTNLWRWGLYYRITTAAESATRQVNMSGTVFYYGFGVVIGDAPAAPSYRPVAIQQRRFAPIARASVI